MKTNLILSRLSTVLKCYFREVLKFEEDRLHLEFNFILQNPHTEGIQRMTSVS